MTEDLIKRSDAIEAAGDQSYIAYEIRKKLRMIPSAEPTTKVVAQVNFDEDQMREIVEEKVSELLWIPCSERLPEKTKASYIVTVIHEETKETWVDIDSYDWEGHNGWWNFGEGRCHVIAWMPLPNPYKEEEDDE